MGGGPALGHLAWSLAPHLANSESANHCSSFGHIVAPFWAIATCLATPGIIENYYSVSSLYVKIRIGTLELLIDTVVGRNPSHDARKGNGRPESAARASILPEPCSFYYHSPPTTVLAAACQHRSSTAVVGSYRTSTRGTDLSIDLQ